MDFSGGTVVHMNVLPLLILLAVALVIEFAACLRWGAPGVWRGAFVVVALLLLAVGGVVLWLANRYVAIGFAPGVLITVSGWILASALAGCVIGAPLGVLAGRGLRARRSE